ncbi:MULTISPECIES: hypothetical protein [unclassified Mycobacterium]|uniref:hypothetical protein n=1 Tax=unclassified Mycobacterium TaxID=2642494 RepID=UPI0007FE8537|nr:MULTISPECIES: hypothetical protein [unclassified Mycobacterium]OBG58887.1 hypothetical protein A5703_03015 [Mycobacterium sp. E188]OBH37264.1 hypothetical protein A5691_26915 [Mycobacterium sp. E183]
MSDPHLPGMSDDDHADHDSTEIIHLEDFWDRRPVLKHVRNFARSRRACPDSTLAAVLVRAVCQIPQWATLPPIVGGRTAVNLFAGLVGESGGGKGASEATGRDAIAWDNRPVGPVPERPLGSGEGLARTYMNMQEEAEKAKLTAAVFTVLWSAPEIDTLTALFARQGATLHAELRKLYMGEQLGFTNSGKDTRTRVDRLTYRAGLIAGVQPLRAGTLLDAADGGTPQRFLWAWTRDPDMPEQRPDAVEPRTVAVPTFLPGDLRVPQVARDAIERHQLDYHHGEPGIDPLDGHALLTQLKVAAALMVLDERTSISDDDWELAGQVMARSDGTRDAVAREAAEQRRRRNRAKAADTAERDDYLSDSRVQRAKRTILRWLSKLPDGKAMAHHELRRRLQAKDRDDFDPAIAELIEECRVTKVPLTRGYGYMRKHGNTDEHGDSPAGTDRVASMFRVFRAEVLPGETTEAHPNPCEDCGGTDGHKPDCLANPDYDPGPVF